jgi:inorganic pyrophosphatase
MTRPPLTRLGSATSTASRRVWRTSAALAHPTSTAPPSSFPFNSPLSRAAQVSRHFSTPTMSYTVRKVGSPYTLEHRVFVEKDGVPVSPFHDIPLYANEQQTILNMVVEIPRWTNAKQEVRLPISN